MAADDYAVVVGIDKYPGLSDLSGPSADAREFYSWLIDGDGGDVPAANIGLLITPDFQLPEPCPITDAKPMDWQISDLFRPYVVKAANGRVGRRLYIFMAGHGFSDSNRTHDVALFSANAELFFPKHVAATAYADWFKRNALFDQIVLIMDCCRTNSQIHSIPDVGLPNLTNRNGGDVRTFYAFGTTWGSPSREREINGEVRGIFTTALVRALEEAKPNNRGRVTGSAIQNHIHTIIDDIADGVAIKPPDIQVDPHREIVFAERKEITTSTVTISLDPYNGDETIIVLDGARKEVARIDATTATVELNLGIGIYKAYVDQAENRSDYIEVTGGDHAVKL